MLLLQKWGEGERVSALVNKYIEKHICAFWNMDRKYLPLGQQSIVGKRWVQEDIRGGLTSVWSIHKLKLWEHKCTQRVPLPGPLKNNVHFQTMIEFKRNNQLYIHIGDISLYIIMFKNIWIVSFLEDAIPQIIQTVLWPPLQTITAMLKRTEMQIWGDK